MPAYFNDIARDASSWASDEKGHADAPGSFFDGIARFNSMIIDRASPLNQGALKYLARGERSRFPVITAPESVKDPYMGQGGHPDVVQRIWDELGGKLPSRCGCLNFGNRTRCSGGCEMDALAELGSDWIFGGLKPPPRPGLSR
jgi:hypothetical protein